MGVERGLFNRLLIGNVSWSGARQGRGKKGRTSTATTQQMATGQRDRVAKFANRRNKFDSLLKIIRSTKLPAGNSFPSTPADVAISLGIIGLSSLFHCN